MKNAIRDSLVRVVWWVYTHRKTIIVWLVIIVVATVAYNWFQARSGPAASVLSTTNLRTTRNFAYKQGDEVLAYNGLAFYSTNVVTGQRKILHSGTKLPAVKSMYWLGTNGVLMVFNDNYYGTPVNGFLAQEGKALDDTTKNYTWYLNFKTTTLTDLSERPIDTGPTYYDEAANTFYYTEITKGSSDGDKERVYSFDVVKGTVTLLLDKADITEISSIAKCTASPLVCIIGHLNTSESPQQVYAITKNGSTRELLDSGIDGKILPTAIKDHYIVSTLGDNGALLPAVVHDVSSDQVKTRRLKFTIDENTHMHYVSGSAFFAVNTRGAATFQTGNIKGRGGLSERKLKLNGEDYKGTISGVQSSSGNNVSLVSNPDSRQYLFGPKPLTTLSSIAKKEDVQLAVAECNKRSNTTNKYNDNARSFQIVVIALPGFATAIKNFGNCMAKDHADKIHGYYYSFIGTNTTDGDVVVK